MASNLLNFELFINFVACCKKWRVPWADPVEGDRGVLTPLKNHKNIGFLSNTDPDPLKNHQASIQCLVIIGTPAKCHSNGVSLAGGCWPDFSGIWIHSLTKKSWTLSEKIFWIRSWFLQHRQIEIVTINKHVSSLNKIQLS